MEDFIKELQKSIKNKIIKIKNTPVYKKEEKEKKLEKKSIFLNTENNPYKIEIINEKRKTNIYISHKEKTEILKISLEKIEDKNLIKTLKNLAIPTQNMIKTLKKESLRFFYQKSNQKEHFFENLEINKEIEVHNGKYFFIIPTIQRQNKVEPKIKPEFIKNPQKKDYLIFNETTNNWTSYLEYYSFPIPKNHHELIEIFKP